MGIFPRTQILFQIPLVFTLSACGQAEKKAAEPPMEKDQELAIILNEAAKIGEIAFPGIVEASTGWRILPCPAESPHLDLLAEVFNESIVAMSAEGSPVRNLRRINEASRFFEDDIRERINRRDGYRCTIPLTASGAASRTGYPDLRIEHAKTEFVLYLEPKIYESGSEKSSLRTFYYTPGREKTKILEDAHHVLVGIAHDGNDGRWNFLRWQMVDLAHLRVRLKTEMQASNRDLYNGNGNLRKSSGDTQRN